MPIATRLEKLTLDPPHRRAARLFKVGRRIGLLKDFALGSLPAVGRLVAREGLGPRTVHALHAINVPDRPALVDRHRTVTYAEANAEINRLANALAERWGVGARTPVILMMENRTEYAIAWFALFRLGARAVHAAYRLKRGELAYQVRHSGARIVIASEACAAVPRELAKSDPDLDLALVQVGGRPAGGEGPETVAYDELVAAGSADFPPRTAAGDGNENVVYTSGTTGKPKGAVRDFAATNTATFFRLLERLPMRSGDRHLVVSPMYHSGGQAFTLMQTVLGATIHMLDHFDPAHALEAFDRWRIHSAFMVPTMIRRILDLPAEFHERFPAADLTCIVSGAAAFPTELRQRAIERFGARVIHDFYGATELGWVTLIDGEEMLARPGSVGRPNAGQVVGIFDEAGNLLPPNEVGLVYVKNEQTMIGYLDDPEATAKGRMGEWLTVDDLGYLDADGYLYLSGRARDMVITGGVNVYPVEIEEALGDHPNLRELAVIGVPDADWGERLVGVVVPRDPAAFDPAELTAYAKERLASFKVPKQWETVEELPRNPTGKVIKRELEERFADPSTA